VRVQLPRTDRYFLPTVEYGASMFVGVALFSATENDSASDGNAPLRTSASSLHGVLDARAERLVAAHEARLERLVHAEHVVRHEHLTVAARAGADADRRDREALRDLAPMSAESLRGRSNTRPRPRASSRPTTGARGRRRRGLDLEAAELVIALRVRPMWPMTGMPALTSRCTSSAWTAPPRSSPSGSRFFISRPALVTPCSYEA